MTENDYLRILISIFSILSMANKVEGYTAAELQQLHRSAEHLLGWQIIFDQLHIPANATEDLRARVLSSRSKVAMAISAIDFFPTQDEQWQAKMEKGTSPDRPRGPLQIFTTSTMGNPLVSVVLQKSPKAGSHPLAVIKRVMAATSRDNVEEFSWKAILTGKQMGIPSKQLVQTMEAMNFADIKSGDSPVQLKKITGLRPEMEECEPADNAHIDLNAHLLLSKETKKRLETLLIERFIAGQQ